MSHVKMPGCINGAVRQCFVSIQGTACLLDCRTIPTSVSDSPEPADAFVHMNVLLAP
jgi:hypothetical protein